MARIVKPTGFFKKNYYYIMGGFWFLSGAVMLILNEGFIFYLYMPLGLGMMIYGYSIRKKTEEFISWNNKGLLIRDLANGNLSYPWIDIDTIFISNNHLTIKSGAANGIIFDLMGFAEEDLNLLKAGIETHSQPQITPQAVF